MDVVYVVTSSLFSQNEHTVDAKAFHTEESCKEYFIKKYNGMVEMCKRHCDNVIGFWDAFRKQEPLPETGKYIFVNNMCENDRSVSYIEDDVTKVSYHISYCGIPIGE